jgi:hypothetical protein
MIGSTETLVGKKVVIDPSRAADPMNGLEGTVGKTLTILTERKVRGETRCTVADEQGRPLRRVGNWRGTAMSADLFINAEWFDPAPANLKPGAAPRVVTTDAKEKVQMSTDPILSLTNRIAADAKAARRSIAEQVTSLSATDLEDYMKTFNVGGAGVEVEAASAPLAASDVTALRAVVALLHQPGITPEKAVAGLRAHFGGAPSDGPQVSEAEAQFIAASKSIAARDRIDLAQATKKACIEREDLYKRAYPEHEAR